MYHPQCMSSRKGNSSTLPSFLQAHASITSLAAGTTVGSPPCPIFESMLHTRAQHRRANHHTPTLQGQLQRQGQRCLLHPMIPPRPPHQECSHGCGSHTEEDRAAPRQTMAASPLRDAPGVVSSRLHVLNSAGIRPSGRYAFCVFFSFPFIVGGCRQV